MIEIHTLAWNDDHAARYGEKSNGSIYAKVFVDGAEIPQVVRVRTHHRGDDFTTAVVTLHGPVTVINHDEDSWAELDGGPSCRA